MSINILIAISVVLVFLSMIFSAAESAFLSINKLRVRLLRNKKNRRATRVWRLLNNKDRLINTLLVGNNIVNIALSSIFTYIAIELFGNAGVGLATFVVTLVLLIFGEISPKTIATHNPEPIAFFFSGFISCLEVILYPLVYIFTKVTGLFLKVANVDVKKETVTFTEEEIKIFLEVGKEQGILEKNESSMMHKVFRFSDLSAKAIMIPRKHIIAIREDFSYSKVIEYSQRYRLSRFPIYRSSLDDITGILYVKDMLPYKMCPEKFEIKKVMRPPLFILESKNMSGIQQMLRENRQSMAVVIDEYSGTKGVLTVEDLVKEIFGTIEYKPYSRISEIKAKNTTSSEVDGLFRIIDINQQLELNIVSENCETIGGYICEKLGEIPSEGQSIVIGNYKFIVTKMDDKRVGKIRVIYMGKES
ncbi:MAG: hemolysin family protein [Treponema sp.]|nr:hemolysin family protein [Spirochaetia bacterium]MDY3759008.1 hemolysin family protein [Treponema sp.]